MYLNSTYANLFEIFQEKKCLLYQGHHSFVVINPKSISGIGYEDYLYDSRLGAEKSSIEENLNIAIETPFTSTTTWKKIVSDEPHLIDETDKLNLYLLSRHLYARNIEMLAFLKNEIKKVKETGFPADFTEDERQMYQNLAASESRVNYLYLKQVLDIDRFILNHHKASIQVIVSTIPLRTSTNPVIAIPESLGEFRQLGENIFVYWLPLSIRFGVMLIISDVFCEFRGARTADNDFIRMLNRLYIIQLLELKSVRYCIADDSYIDDDMAWAGFVKQNNAGKYKRSNIR